MPRTTGRRGSGATLRMVLQHLGLAEVPGEQQRPPDAGGVALQRLREEVEDLRRRVEDLERGRR